MNSGILPTTPTAAIVQVSLEAVAQEINSEHEACCAAASQALDHAMRCGDLLLQAKGECSHGTWQKWLADNFKGSKRTAQQYMRLAKHREQIESNAQTSALLTVDEATKLIASPVKDESALDHIASQNDDFSLPDLDGSCGYVTVCGRQKKWAQVWPDSIDDDGRVFYHVTVWHVWEDELSQTIRPVIAEFVGAMLDHFCFELPEGEGWSCIDEPIFSIHKYEPRWPERHKVEQAIRDVGGPFSGAGSELLQIIKTRELWLGCFVSFADYCERAWGDDGYAWKQPRRATA
ncbi:DUF3102 domain-containing protein [Pirellulales bacterium]|nr:DUF3102 domain-containing protein [Pirellulales bacterium]